MRRLRHAGAMTFWVYVITTLLALVPTLAGLSALSLPVAADHAGGAAVLEALEEAGDGLAVTTRVALLMAALLWLLSPLLQMAWLAALEQPRSVAQSLGLGASRTLPAVLVSLVMLLPLLVVLVLLLGLPALAHLALSDGPNARTHDLVVAALLIPGLLALAAWSAWHDLARAELGLGAAGPLRAVRSAWRQMGVRAVAPYLGWTLLAALLALLGHALGGWLHGALLWQAVALLALLQILALLRVACRGAWLGAATDMVARRRPTAPTPDL